VTRRLDKDGNPCFGNGPGDFVYGAAEAAQCAKTRLALQRADWFLDITAGVRWRDIGDGGDSIFSRHSSNAFVETELKACILGGPGIASLLAFDYVANHATRAGVVVASIETVDGDVQNIRVDAP
jgi:hypothetical protein